LPAIRIVLDGACLGNDARRSRHDPHRPVDPIAR
jgi:hypothetical protein